VPNNGLALTKKKRILKERIPKTAKIENIAGSV
jgi:hypothetical protein